VGGQKDSASNLCAQTFDLNCWEGFMDNWTFAITMIVVGMGGTLLTLWILSLLMSLLKKAFPYKKEEEGK